MTGYDAPLCRSHGEAHCERCTDGIATGLSRAIVALEAYDYEPFERKGMEQAIHLVRELLESAVD